MPAAEGPIATRNNNNMEHAPTPTAYEQHACDTKNLRFLEQQYWDAVWTSITSEKPWPSPLKFVIYDQYGNQEYK
jgi:hypothetical protein